MATASSSSASESEGNGPMGDSRFSDWTRGEYLGAGHFAKVYKCYAGDEIFAEKIVKMEPQYTESQEEVKVLNNEISILKKLEHKRIVSYHGSEQKDGYLHLFMDFMAGGSLSDHIKRNGVLSECLSKTYTGQMLEGVCFLHSQNIIHRDIKGSNVLLDGKGNVKLADFGLSKMIQKVGSKTNLLSHCGSPHWMAPEIIRGEGYGRKADIWSLGCTVVEMLTGKPPLDNLEPVAAMFRIGSEPLELTLPESVSKDAKKFIKAALTWKPEKRPWSEELQRYKFVSKGLEKPSVTDQCTSRTEPRLSSTCKVSNIPQDFLDRFLTKRMLTIPTVFGREICRKLAKSREFFFWDDNRLLAEKIGLEVDAMLLHGHQNNPTELILQVFDTQEDPSIRRFKQILEEMERNDVVKVIEDWLLYEWNKQNNI